MGVDVDVRGRVCGDKKLIKFVELGDIGGLKSGSVDALSSFMGVGKIFDVLFEMSEYGEECLYEMCKFFQ